MFTPIITQLINLMLTHSVIPPQLKTSCITPLYKKGQSDNLSNYRPVGSLPIIEKVLEKHINNITQKYLSDNDIIPHFQHGFQSKKSTITLLQEFSNKINTALDERKCVVVILVDLSFAFDAINHGLLLQKFQDIGMNHPIFKTYFESRKQVTRIGPYISDEESVEYGLVQGGINSPTWYNVYTYDIKYIKRTGDLLMFADDSCIISIHRNVEMAIKNAQNDFINLQKYLYNNHIYLNEKKTEALILGYKSKQVDLDQYRLYCHSRTCLENKTYEATCACYRIEYAEKAKYLGVIVDNEFKMTDHVNSLCKKLRVLNYKFNKIDAQKFPLTTKKTIYFSLVDSILRYGVTLYTYAPQYALNPLNSLQNRIRKLLFGNCRISILTPQQLATFVLLYLNFFDEKYRHLNTQPYELRTQRYRRPHVYSVQYGERRLEFIIPFLLNTYCQQFLSEMDKHKVKMKIKEKILRQRE
ncbi:hypothetical protein M8J77_005104 [Diaphorina citri]|nr:hypothetical protein M8J77_005104 [Diaphorina citri]